MAPKKNADKFIRQAGVIVRDQIPITIQEWNKPKADGVSYVDDRSKEVLWKTLMANFTLPPEVDPNNKVIERKVKAWTLSKMAQQFCNGKKRLNSKFVKENKTPKFEGEYEKIKDHLAEFVEYKTSAEAKKKSAVNKVNASKKEYHHVTGSGGYRGQRPKWEKAEKDLLDKGINPETSGWSGRAKTWFYGVGGKLDPETGKCVFTKEILATPLATLKTAFQESREGKFDPDREKDELTRAIGKPEHPGRTRGTDGSMPWKDGFAEWSDSYRWRGRKEKERTDRMQQIEETLGRLQAQLDAHTSQQATGPSQRQYEDPAFDATGPLSQRKSSVASTEHVQPIHDITAPRYPVDDITHRENFELHVKCMGISMKVAVGSALPPVRGGTYHCSPIPDGYAVVGVDEVVKGFEQAQLDFATGEGETELQYALKTTILWKKENIVLPNWKPPTPQPSPPRQQSPPPQPSPSPQPSPAHQ